MELKSMTDFVLEQNNIEFKNKGRWDEARWQNSLRYANFLKQPLTLSMFVPCGDDGQVLEEPSNYKEWNKKECEWWDNYTECLGYQQAKERCLFDVFEMIKDSTNKTVTMVWETKEHQKLPKDRKVIGFGFSKRNQGTIENYIHYNLTLTQTAINQITK